MTHQTADKFAAYIAEILDFGYHEYNGNLNDKNLQQLHNLFLKEGRKAREINSTATTILSLNHLIQKEGATEERLKDLKFHTEKYAELRGWK